MKENLNILNSDAQSKELINNTVTDFNNTSLKEINIKRKNLEKEIKKLNLKKEKLTNILADKEIKRKKQESNKEKKNNIRKSKTESNIFFQKDIEDKNVVKRFMELASSNKRIINNKNIHEIRDSWEIYNPRIWTNWEYQNKR